MESAEAIAIPDDKSRPSAGPLKSLSGIVNFPLATSRFPLTGDTNAPGFTFDIDFENTALPRIEIVNNRQSIITAACNKLKSVYVCHYSSPLLETKKKENSDYIRRHCPQGSVYIQQRLLSPCIAIP